MLGLWLGAESFGVGAQDLGLPLKAIAKLRD